MRNPSQLMIVAVLVGIMSLLGCSSDKQATGPETEVPPSLPPVNTMSMDVEFFQDAEIDTQSKSLGLLDESIVASPAALKLNYLNAAVRVFFLNVVTYTVLAHPVAAFAKAIHSVPQYQQDGSWLWTYIYIDKNGSEYSIFLRGQRMESHVAWSMEVSSNDPALLLDHFLWFEGEVANDGQSGYWQFYEPDSSEVTSAASFAEYDASTIGIPCVHIDWRRSSRVDQRLAFLINKPGGAAEGSTLIFEEELELSTLEFYDAANGNSGTIVWYRDGSGSIEWPDYKDGVRSCWDVWQYDIDCE